MQRQGPFGYEIQRSLGRGASGDVYLAWDLRLKRRVSLKRLGRTEAVSSLTREAQALARVRSPHIARVYDIAIEDPDVWMVMEFVDGWNLQELFRRKSDVPTGRALAWIFELASALEALAAVGVVHRDVKPANIIMRKDFSSCLVDFGLAVTSGGKRDDAGIGTPAYMSPEQIRGDQVGPRTDVYSLGLVGYHLLTGSHAFSGRSSSVTEMMQAQLSQSPASVRSVNKQVPRKIDRMIQKCLEKRATSRPTARDVRQQTERYAAPAVAKMKG